MTDFNVIKDSTGGFSVQPINNQSDRSNNDNLFGLMRNHNLTAPQVAKMLCVSVACVNSWRRKNGNVISDGYLQLLKIKIAIM